MTFDHDEFSRRLRAISEADGIVPLGELVTYGLEMLGVTACYVRSPLTSDPRVKAVVLTSGLPAIWERHYRERLYLIDPLPQIAMRKMRPFAWPAEVRAEMLDDRQRRYMQMAARHGIVQGIGVACYGPNGRAGFMGAILRPGSGQPAPVDLLRVHAVAQLSFLRYCSLIQREADIQPLSNRELEVLHWMAQGKSNPVIAKILGISPSSVDIYVKRLFSKLGVADRTSAAVRAYSLGFLTPSDPLPHME